MDLLVNNLQGMNHKIISTTIILSRQINNLTKLAKKISTHLAFYQPKLNHFYAKNNRRILQGIQVCLIIRWGINRLQHLILIQVFST